MLRDKVGAVLFGTVLFLIVAVPVLYLLITVWFDPSAHYPGGF